MGDLTFVSVPAVPFRQHCSFGRHFSWSTRRFGSSASASISHRLCSAGSTLSVKGPLQILSSFALKATQQVSRFSAATVHQEGHAPMEARR